MDRDFGSCLPLIPGLTLDLFGAEGSIIKTFDIDRLLIAVIFLISMLYLILIFK